MRVIDEYLELESSIEIYINEIQRLYDLAASMPVADASSVDGFSGKVDFTNEIVKAVDLAEELKQKTARFLELKEHILRGLDELDNSTQALVLKYRIFEKMPFWEIAERTRLTERQVYNLKNAGIKALDKIL